MNDREGNRASAAGRKTILRHAATTGGTVAASPSASGATCGNQHAYARQLAHKLRQKAFFLVPLDRLLCLLLLFGVMGFS